MMVVGNTHVLLSFITIICEHCPRLAFIPTYLLYTLLGTCV